MLLCMHDGTVGTRTHLRSLGTQTDTEISRAAQRTRDITQGFDLESIVMTSHASKDSGNREREREREGVREREGGEGARGGVTHMVLDIYEVGG